MRPPQSPQRGQRGVVLRRGGSRREGSFKNLRYESPRHLPNRTIQVRFERHRPSRKLVVYYKGERMGEARPVDFTANDRHPRNAAPGMPPAGSERLDNL